MTRNAQSPEQKKYVVTFFILISFHSESAVKAVDNFEIPNPVNWRAGIKDNYGLG